MVTQIDPTTDITRNLASVNARITDAARAVGRSPAEVTLVGITKFHQPAAIRAGLEAGLEDIGENRVQDAEAKWPAIKSAFPDARLHLVGPLQRNKVRRAVALFDVIASVDRLRLARALADEMERSGRRPDCLIEVNTGEESQKSGVLPDEADALIETCRTDYRCMF